MSRHLRAVLFSVCAIVSLSPTTRSQGQPGMRVQGIVLEISIIELTGAPPETVEKIEQGKDQISRLVSEGKARLITNLEIRTRVGKRISLPELVSGCRFILEYCHQFKPTIHNVSIKHDL